MQLVFTLVQHPSLFLRQRSLRAAGLGTGTKIEIACDGADEQAALDALVALVDSGFGE